MDIINTNCVCMVCKIMFSDSYDSSVILYPCNHVIHYKCLYKLDNICLICNKYFKKYYTLNELKQLYPQKNKLQRLYINLLSVTYFKPENINYFKVLSNIYKCIDFIGNLLIQSRCINEYNYEHVYDNFIDDLLNACNIRIFIKGKENLINTKKVYICNHHFFLDSAILYRIFHTGFVVKKNYSDGFIKEFFKYNPMVYIDRRIKNSGSLNEIKKHIDKYSSICIFPEGTILNMKTLGKFRTGAFNTGYPVQPVIMRFSKEIYGLTAVDLVLKLFEGNQIDCFVDILPLEEGNFDNNRIEDIRRKMAQEGNFMLSDVGNRYIYEE